MSSPAKYGPFPAKQLYLIHGNNEVEVNDARYELVSAILTPEERDSGLTEIRSAGNQPLTLDNALNEILSELGTSSFIGGSRRVVVVYDLKDFFEAKRGGAKSGKGAKPKKSPARDTTAIFADWIAKTLPTTENIVVFVCQENDEKQRTVSDSSELYQLCRDHGLIVVKRDKPFQYDLEERVLGRNTAGAVTLLRAWLKRGGSDSTTRSRVYSTVSNIVELALQARCVASARTEGIPVNQVQPEGFPSLSRIPDWKAKKIHTFAQGFSMERLRGLVEQVNRLQTVMYPTGEEDYVPDWEDMLESIVVQLTVRGS